MSNWSEEQEKQRDIKARKASYKDKIGGYFLDLSKLTFAGLVIGGLMSVDLDDISCSAVSIIVMGILFTVLLGRIGREILR